MALAQPAGPLQTAREALDARELDRARALLGPLTQGPDAREAAEALYLLGAVEDEALAFPAAREAYRASVARDPSSRYAGRALARAEELGAHAEGGFGPLRRLERVRRDPRVANDPGELEGLEREAVAFPPGKVRGEALFLVGEAYLGRLDRPRDALRVFRLLATDPGADGDLRDLAGTRMLDARRTLGEASEAVEDLRAVRGSPELQAEARVLARRVKLHRAALAVLALALFLGTTALTRAARGGRLGAVLRAWARPLPWVHLGLLGLGGGALARAFDEHDPGPFHALGAGSLVLYLLMSGWAVVGARRWAPARAAVGALSVLALSYLVMEQLDPRMLEGIHL
ncbi:MAG: hypothetical protein HY909_09045 [Deltaproteobacteria bacterium]|nr:hypothetical protein [Deltaproteobacteria bacterium]